ncbi:MAG TPA: hypothetical protein VK909_14280 [Anaerolineales bacterium]|nr:hypothetical protein [Anaerolineales bacterium]
MTIRHKSREKIGYIWWSEHEHAAGAPQGGDVTVRERGGVVPFATLWGCIRAEAVPVGYDVN